MAEQRGFVVLASAVLAVAAAPARGAYVEPVAARHGMVASTSPIASRIGADVLAHGGNAADAAVAVALALAVVWPPAGNLGGGGFLLWRGADGRAEVIDYRERAPAAASRDMYLDAQGRPIRSASTVGLRAVAVPGTPAGLEMALSRHGNPKRREQLFAPAIKLAREGFLVDAPLARNLGDAAKLLAGFPETARVLLRDGRPLGVGDRLVQPDLARSLELIAKQGAEQAFYRGPLGQKLVEEMRRHGGLVAAADLSDYRPVLREPLRGSYRGHDLLTVGPPSSGGVALLEALNILERYPLPDLQWQSAEQVHLLVEAMRRAFADRASLLGDADFVKVPVRGLISKEYAARRAATIDPRKATPSTSLPAGEPLAHESPETTHFTIVDAEGNVVSNTYTLNGSFGCGAIAPGTGILLNNEMDDFTARPGTPNAYGLIQGEANAIAPRKRPLSSMTPAIVLKDGKLVLAVGSPGGPGIISTVLQVLVNVLDYRMNLREAIQAPRIHHQFLPDVLYLERFALSPETRAALQSRGHVLAPNSALFPPYVGDAQGIAIDPANGMRLGASDPRLGGAAIGY